MKNKDQLLLEQAYEQIASSFDGLIHDLSKGLPGPNVFTFLKNVKNSNNVNELINHLNELGKEDETNWVLKDKLIKTLFMFLSKNDF
jgi:hypothetical protein